MNKTLSVAIRLLAVFQKASISSTQISVWRVSLQAIKNKYAKKLRKKCPKQHHKENLEQSQELIGFLEELEKSIE